jgi:hypothetical protein
MPVDPSIPLSINPPPGPQQLMSLYQLAQSLKAQRQQEQQFNALRELAARKDSFDDKGRPTSNFLRGLQQIDPMKAMEAYDQLAQADEREAMAAQHKAVAMKDKMEASHGVASEAIDAYDAALKGGLSEDAAKAKAQGVYTEGLDRLKKSGMFSADEAASVPTEFDPVTTRANAGKTQEWLKRLDEEDKIKAEQALAKKREDREEAAQEERARHDKVTEGIEAGNLKLHRDEFKLRKEQAESARLDQGTVDSMADQYLAGDKSVLGNLGRGAQGAENIVRVREAIYRRAQAAGMSPADIARQLASYAGDTQAQRTLGQRSAQIDLAANEAEKFAGQALEASSKVGRFGWVQVNKALQGAETSFSNPELKKLRVAVDALVNARARAISPTGVPHVADQEVGRRLLSSADGPEAFKAAVEQMEAEVRAARQASADTRAEARHPDGPQEAKAPVSVKTPADAQKLKPGTHYRTPDGREFIR